MAEPLRGLAPAKVNLVLEILGRRDDGYHEIDTVLQELEIADVVEVAPAAEWGIEVTGPRVNGTPADETNLALKAARLLAEGCPLSGPVRIRLEKHIPAAGGLGGGASDAATTLRLLQQLWDAPEAAVRSVAESVGSDEAFFLLGGTARATGRGEHITPLSPLAPHDAVLFVPPQTIEGKTARMFAALGQLPFDSGSIAASFASSPPGTVTMESTFNAFERVAFDLFPWLADLWEDVEQRTGETIRLCGAGPCLFWIGAEGGEAVANAAQGADCEVVLTRTVAR